MVPVALPVLARPRPLLTTLVMIPTELILASPTTLLEILPTIFPTTTQKPLNLLCQLPYRVVWISITANNVHTYWWMGLLVLSNSVSKWNRSRKVLISSIYATGWLWEDLVDFAWSARITRINRIWKSNTISRCYKMRIFRATIESILVYGTETRTIVTVQTSLLRLENFLD